MKIIFTVVLSILSTTIFAQDIFKKNTEKLFAGLHVDSEPEEMITTTNFKFEKILKKKEITGELVTIYRSNYDKNVLIKSKILNAELRIEQKDYEKKLGRHTVLQSIALPNYQAVIQEYNNIYNQFEPYASNIMIESPENEDESEGREIQARLTFKDDDAVKYLTLSYIVPPKKDYHKTQYLSIIYQYRKY